MTDTPKYDDGGQAYPDPAPTEYGHQGMTLADHIAGRALAGILAANPIGPEDWDDKCSQGYAAIAPVAYRYADAMIAEKRRRERAPIDYARSVTQPNGSKIATQAEIARRNGN